MEVAVESQRAYNARTMPKVKTKTAAVSFRLTEDAARLLAASARERGVSQVAVLEEAIRDYAKAHKVKLPALEPES